MGQTTPQNLTGNRLKIAQFVEHKYFIGFITALILINAITLGMETDVELVKKYGPILFYIDVSILTLFSIEILLKLFAYRLAFFRSGWNVFDFIIVALSWPSTQSGFAVLRTLRILRVLRLISIVPQMRKVVTALGYSLPGMASVIGVLCIVFYVSAVLCTKLFGTNPDPFFQEYFGSISASAYTLFQVMTLENWSDGVVRPVMKEYPYAWVFFLPFIIITSFAVLNLFIGIIVDAMAYVAADKKASDTAKASGKPKASQQIDPQDYDNVFERLIRIEDQQDKILALLDNKKDKN